jgi:hypothetical protein
MPPTRIHMSGNGLHGIYVLKKPVTGDPRTVLRRLSDIVGGDRKVCHPAALMRMPGTHNSKQGDWKLVEVLSDKVGLAYHYDDMKKWLVQSSQQPVIERTAGAANDTSNDPFKRIAEEFGFKPPIDAEARLRAMEHMVRGCGRSPNTAAGHR